MGFEKEFSSWDELQKQKDLIKLHASFNSLDKSWEIKDYVENVDGMADAVATVSSIGREEARRIVEEYNNKVI